MKPSFPVRRFTRTTRFLGGALLVIGTFALSSDVRAQDAAPTVLSINRANGASQRLNTGSEAVFTVTFSEPVTGVDLVDFNLGGTSNAGAGLNNVVAAPGGAVYNVTVTPGSGPFSDGGNIDLDLADNDSILDADEGNLPLGGAGFNGNPGDGSFVFGEFYTVNSRPQLGTNNGLEAGEGGATAITRNQLNTFDNDGDVVTFTVTRLPDAGVGFLSVNGMPIGLNGTFSQTDIDNSLVTFTPANGVALGTQAGFDFTFADAFGGTSDGPSTFNITVIEAQSLVVTTLADEDNNIDQLTSLREAIDFANSNEDLSSITFAVSGTITLQDRLPDLAASTTISNGPSGTVTIDGAGVGRIFSWEQFKGEGGGAATITFNGLILVGGATNGEDGGAVFNGGGNTLILNNCTFTGNSAQGGDGGAVFNGGTLVVNGGAFNSNTAQGGDGGAIENRGTLTITGASFTNNNAVFSTDNNGGRGGAINQDNNFDFDVSPSIAISGSTLTGNTAIEGGAINADFGGGSLSVVGSTISGNSATGVLVEFFEGFFGGQGGGIAAGSDDVELTGSTVSNNTARVPAGGNGNDGDGDRGALGGGIYSFSNLLITGSTISGNSAVMGGNGFARGGGIWSDDAVEGIIDSVVSGNSATVLEGGFGGAQGGGLYTDDEGDDVLISGSTFSGNSTNGGAIPPDTRIQVVGGGGAIFAGANVTLVNSTLSGNSANGASNLGGGLFSGDDFSDDLPDITVRDSTITLNTAAQGAGVFNNANLRVSNSIVAGNTLDNVFNDPDEGSFVDGGTNLLTGDPLLGLLQNNGGPTPTHLPLPGSPAIDVGQSNQSVDQRGVTRPQGVADDIGAVEVQGTTLDLNPSDPTFNTLSAFVEGTPADLTPNGVAIGVAGTATITSASVTLPPRLDGDSVESLSVATEGTPFTATYDPATGVLSITGTGTIEQYRAILDAVLYNNTSDNPTSTPRAVSFSVSATEGPSVSATSTLSLGGVNDAPIITVPSSQSANEDSALTFSSTSGNGISVSDVDAPTLIVDIAVTKGVFSLSRLDGINLRNGDGSANARMSFSGSVAAVNAALEGLTFTPDANASGSARLTINVGDGGGSGSGGELFDRETVDITLGDVNDAPVAVSGSLIVDEDTNGFGTLSGSDSDNDALTFVVKTQPANGVVTLGANGAFTYRPSLSFNGSDSFTFAAFDGQVESAPATISLTVNAVNDAPSAPSVTLSSTNPGTNDTLTATATATDAEGSTVTFSYVWKRNGAVIPGESGSSIDLSKTGNGDEGDFISVEVTANDGQLSSPIGSASARVALAPGVVNQPPVATSRTVSASEETSVSITLAATDVENDLLTFGIVSNPQNGTLSGTAPNLVYTPRADFSGTDSFTFRANDGFNNSNLATVSINVSEGNDAPTITAIGNQTLVQGSSTSALPFSVNDQETPAASLVVSALSSNPTLVPDANIALGGSGANRSVQVTSVAGASGTAIITLFVRDAEGLVGSTSFTVTVTAANRANSLPTISNIAPQIVVQDGATGVLPFTVGDAETPADALTVSSRSGNTMLVPNANIVLGGSGANRSVQVTPAAGASGTATITLTVRDADGATTSSVFELTVNAGVVVTPPTGPNSAPFVDEVGTLTGPYNAPLNIVIPVRDADGIGDIAQIDMELTKPVSIRRVPMLRFIKGQGIFLSNDGGALQGPMLPSGTLSNVLFTLMDASFVETAPGAGELRLTIIPKKPMRGTRAIFVVARDAAGATNDAAATTIGFIRILNKNGGKKRDAIPASSTKPATDASSTKPSNTNPSAQTF